MPVKLIECSKASARIFMAVLSVAAIQHRYSKEIHQKDVEANGLVLSTSPDHAALEVEIKIFRRLEADLIDA
jgi:hypothetical protein